jgi:hypothetical protein
LVQPSWFQSKQVAQAVWSRVGPEKSSWKTECQGPGATGWSSGIVLLVLSPPVAFGGR